MPEDQDERSEQTGRTATFAAITLAIIAAILVSMAVDTYWLRDRIFDTDGFVESLAPLPQDPVIFSADAWENIRYGRPEASDEDVVMAAQAAAAHDFLQALPEGLGTFLGERGVRLSGGQRQRIAIARVLILDPQAVGVPESVLPLVLNQIAAEIASRPELEGITKADVAEVLAHQQDRQKMGCEGDFECMAAISKNCIAPISTLI